jgi:hypothetical protein
MPRPKKSSRTESLNKANAKRVQQAEEEDEEHVDEEMVVAEVDGAVANREEGEEEEEEEERKHSSGEEGSIADVSCGARSESGDTACNGDDEPVRHEISLLAKLFRAMKQAADAVAAPIEKLQNVRRSYTGTSRATMYRNKMPPALVAQCKSAALYFNGGMPTTTTTTSSSSSIQQMEEMTESTAPAPSTQDDETMDVEDDDEEEEEQADGDDCDQEQQGDENDADDDDSDSSYSDDEEDDEDDYYFDRFHVSKNNEHFSARLQTLRELNFTARNILLRGQAMKHELICHDENQYSRYRSVWMIFEAIERGESPKQAAIGVALYGSAATFAKTTNYQTRILRDWAKTFLLTGKLPPTRQGKHSKRAWFLDDEAKADAMREWVRSELKSPTSQNAFSPQMFVNHVHIKYHLKISANTARKWLKRLGFVTHKRGGGLFTDGHSRADVVEYREGLVLRMSERLHRIGFMSIDPATGGRYWTHPLLKAGEKEIDYLLLTMKRFDMHLRPTKMYGMKLEQTP